MSFDSVVPKPVYSMVDLDKKRKDRKFFLETHHDCDGSEGINVGSERAIEQGFPADLNLESRGMRSTHSYAECDGPDGKIAGPERADLNLGAISESRGMSSTHSYAEFDGPDGKIAGPERADLNLGAISESRGMSSTHIYDEVAEVKLPMHPAATEEASTADATRLVNSTYTMITKETLFPPKGTEYEDINISVNTSQSVPKKGGTEDINISVNASQSVPKKGGTEDINISVNASQSVPKKGGTLAQKYWCSVIIPVVLFLLLAMSSGLAFTIVKIFELQSQLDSLQHTSDISRLMQSISELRANQSFLSDELDQHILEHLGQPAPSCAALLAFSPTIPSGYYWVRAGNGSAVRVYCDMTRSCGGVTGGWMRVTSLDFSNSSTQCPSGLQERMDSGIRTCGIQSSSPTCASVLFSTSGITYNKACGKVLAYQVGIPNAFGHFGVAPNVTIDSFYVDGVSLTHGSNPREHIWTFAAARDEDGANNTGRHVCECSYNPGHVGGTPPPFVGQDYFCDTGSHSEERHDRFHSASPLWDGSGCGPNSTCCSFNNPPWFHKQLPSPTGDAIEMRVCSDEERANEDIAMSSVHLFVQ